MLLLSTRSIITRQTRSLCPKRRLLSTARSARVELAYQLFEPPAAKGSAGYKRDGRPIVFMHGLFGSKQNNRSINKVLARDLNRDIFIVDLRNHGHTAHAQEHTYTAMAEDVEHFIYQHGLEKVALIGHSMGAKTAMTLALTKPHLVTGLIPVDNAPIDARLSSEFPKYVQGMQEIESAGITRQGEADKILSQYEESLPIRQFLLTNLVRHAANDKDTKNSNSLKFRVPLNIIGSSLSNLGEFPFDAETADAKIVYEGPTLFVRGTKSRYVPDKAVPAIKRFFPKAEVVDVESGHWVISEKPEEFRQAVVKFFRENNVE